ncbi:MAG TPA: DMT family transporter [Candidatus Paceibacterota bacterium]
MDFLANLSWFPYSIGSMLLLAISIVFYKRPAQRGESVLATNFWMFVFFSLLSLVFFHNYFGLTNKTVLLLGALWGVSFAALASFQMYALHHIDTNSLFPVTSTLSLVASVGAALLLFGERFSSLQAAGVVLTILTVYLFLYKGGHLQYSKHILLVGLAVIFFSASNKIIQKFAVGGGDIHVFQIYMYLFGLLGTFLLLAVVERARLKSVISSGIRSGLYIAVPGFLGGYLSLIAFTKGPFALVVSIGAFYTVVISLIGWMFFKEQLTKRKVFLIGLAIVAVLLIRLG